MTKRAKRFLGFAGLLIVFIVGITALTRFAHGQAKLRLCPDLSIKIKYPQSVFIQSEDLASLIEATHLIPVGKTYAKSQTNSIESLMQQQAVIKNAEVYAYPNGNIEVQVVQRRPILTMYTQDGRRFYMDEQGAKIKPNKKYSDRLIVYNGSINSDNNAQIQALHQVAVYIDRDPFLKTLIDQVYVSSNHELLMIPAIGHQVISFGRAEDIPAKFERLTSFYRYGVSKIGWDKYSKINVKFKNQVVCTK